MAIAKSSTNPPCNPLRRRYFPSFNPQFAVRSGPVARWARFLILSDPDRSIVDEMLRAVQDELAARRRPN
jgi:hypothetical protein